MKRLRFDRRLLVALAAALVICAVPAIALASSADVPWQTGMRAVGNGATIEPAVNDVTGAQTFLITPNHSPFWDASQHPSGTPIPSNLLKTSAPLYLVTYPLASTVDDPGSDPLNLLHPRVLRLTRFPVQLRPRPDSLRQGTRSLGRCAG